MQELATPAERRLFQELQAAKSLAQDQVEPLYLSPLKQFSLLY